MVRIPAPVPVCPLRLPGCRSLGRSLRSIQETSWKLFSRAPLTHTLLLIQINRHSWLFGQEPVYTPEHKEKGGRPKEKGGMGIASPFSANKIYWAPPRGPALLWMVQTQNQTHPSGAYAIGFISLTDLHHTSHLPQKVLRDFLSSPQKCLHFNVDVMERL